VVAIRSSLKMAPAVALLLLLGACDDDAGESEGDHHPSNGLDAGPNSGDAQPDVWVAPPLDVAHQCNLGGKPRCNPDQVPPIVPYREGSGCRDDVDCPDGSTCDTSLEVNECRGADGCLLPWECHECPRDEDIRCKEPLVALPDRFGCESVASECGCRFNEAPDCAPNLVPHEQCSDDGRRCFTGTCVAQRCPCIPPVNCEDPDVAELDEDGCLTGACVLPPCADVEPPECVCGERPVRTRSGCIDPERRCEIEHVSCDHVDIPLCPQGQTPELHPVTKCLTGRCVAGFCTDECDRDSDCATSDRCVPYGGGCNTCQPRSCQDDLDCPERTDCVGLRCRLRPTHACPDEGCGGGQVCDDLACGKCAAPCECREHRDCPRGTRCRGCECVLGCRDDDDCDGDLGCDPVTGNCQECTCSENEQCEAGLYCDSCFCREGCRADEECPPWTVCSGESHNCQPLVECRQDIECGRNGLCVDTRCVENPGLCEDGATACGGQWDWRVGDYRCIRDTEQVPNCPDGNACDPPEDAQRPVCLCDFEDCLTAQCDGPNALRCPGAPFHCSKLARADPREVGLCREGRPEERRLCREDADCIPEDCCVATFCVNAANPSCQSRVDCDDTEGMPLINACSCVEGVCRTGFEFPEAPE